MVMVLTFFLRHWIIYSLLLIFWGIVGMRFAFEVMNNEEKPDSHRWKLVVLFLMMAGPFIQMIFLYSLAAELMRKCWEWIKLRW